MLIKKLIKFSFLILALVILTLTIFPLFFDKTKIVSDINSKVKKEYNLDLSFSENIEIKLFPYPEIIVRDVIYKNNRQGLSISIPEVELISTWKSLVKFEPKVRSIHINYPKIKFKKTLASNNLLIFVNNDIEKINHITNTLIQKVDYLNIKKGYLEFFKSNKLNRLKNLDLSLVNSDFTKVEAEFDYVDYKSFIKINAQYKKNKEIDYSISQLFKNEDEIFGSGKFYLNQDKVLVSGKFHSEQLNLTQISKLISQLDLNNHKLFYKVKSNSPNLSFDFDLEIDNLLINKFRVGKIKSKILKKNNEVFIKDFRANYFNSSIKSNAIYSISNKKINGKISIYDFLVERSFLGLSKFDISDALFDCDISFIIDTKKKNHKFLNKLFANGDCIAPEAELIGIDIEKISNGIDNLETFQDFFDLFNKEKMNGNSKIDSINIKFNLKDSVLNINELNAIQRNINVMSSGKYEIYNEKFYLKNNVFIKTKKFTNLPSFDIFINGKSDNYKVSYDFEKIKSAVISNGINSILKNKKKIIIDPKSLKGLLDKNNKNFKPEKIIDLFLN